MSAPQLYGLYPSVIGAVTVNNIDSATPSPGVESIIRMVGGSVDPQLIAMAFADPQVKLASHDVQAILQGISAFNGLAFSAAAVQYQARLQGGEFQGAGSHVKLTSTLGFAHVVDFGAVQDDKEGADININYWALFDGTNLPIVVNLAQSLTGSPAVTALHALGPVVLEGSQLVGVTKWRYTSGIEYRVKRGDGDLFARVGSIVARKPTIEIECLNLSVLGVLGAFQLAATSGVVCYLQKAVAGGGRVPYGTTGHIALTATAGKYKVTDIGVDKDGDAMSKITFHCTTVPTCNPSTTIPL